ncbi:MAG: alpha/beta hydrolase [Caulobacter sp.]|nr:alpha/beta hydrolase [Caulobacter sp.]
MTRALVDPELLTGLDSFPFFELNEGTLPSLRSMMNGLMPIESYRRDDVIIENRIVPGPSGAPDVPVLIYRPNISLGPFPALLHIHGGGYVLGDAEASGPSNVCTAAEVGCVVVSVDYRLAPETVAPGAVEDCYAALRWLHTEADRLGVDRSRIAVGGESAGGGLAAALALLARDRGEYPLCFQMLIYPMIDDRTATSAPDNPNTGEFIWTRSSNRFGWRSLLGEEPGGEGASAYAAPARAKDLAGLPPAYISVGALDLFLDEDIEYARRLLNAGVPTELHIHPGAYHGFELAPEARVTKLSENERRAALARAFENL